MRLSRFQMLPAAAWKLGSLVTWAVLAACPAVPGATAADATPARRAVSFAAGTNSAELRGTVHGLDDVDHTVSGKAGQTLSLSLQSSNPSLYFNVNPPGSMNVSMFIGHQQGPQARLVLPADGIYVVRVYLMRNAARRQARAEYALSVTLAGQAFAPLPAALDTKLAGTPFHATADVPCQTPGADASARCPAGVIRRGRDGTATVVLNGARGLVRQVLFVKGEAVGSDSAQPMVSSRSGDAVTVRFGADERYDLPDALLTGG